MKWLLLCFVFISSTLAYSQGISLFNIDPSGFPTIKAKFYAYDKDGKQLYPEKNKLIITEAGKFRNISDVKNPKPKQREDLSIVIMEDSWPIMSTSQKGMSNFVNRLHYKDELAITYMLNSPVIHLDFTTDKNKIIKSISTLPGTHGNTYIDAVFNHPITGGINLLKKRNSKNKILILLESVHCFPVSGLNKNLIVEEAAKYGIKIFPVVVNANDYTGILKEIAEKTGGYLFERVGNEFEMSKVFEEISFLSNYEPGEISWTTESKCDTLSQIVDLKSENSNLRSEYIVNEANTYKLKSDKEIMFFGPVKPSFVGKQKVIIEAVNTDFVIKDLQIKGSYAYSIENKKIGTILKKGEKLEINCLYSPKDTFRHYGFLEIINDKCEYGISLMGGYPSDSLVGRTLRLVDPNCAGSISAGLELPIVWTGIPRNDRVRIEFSTDKGKNWKTITEGATGWRYIWKYPTSPETKIGMIKISQITNDETSVNAWKSGFEVTSRISRNSHDNMKILYVLKDNSLSIRLSDNGYEILKVNPENSQITDIAWSEDDNKISIAYEDGLISFIDAKTGIRTEQITFNSKVTGMKWNNTSTKIALATLNNTVTIYNTQSRSIDKSYTGLDFSVKHLSWDKNGELTIAGSCVETKTISTNTFLILQQDTTDCLQTIIAPKLEIKTDSIFIGKTILNSVKDTMIKSCICNTGTIPLHILGVDLTSGHISEFGVPLGAGDVFIDPKKCKDVMFTFNPKYTGMRNGKFTIRTTSGDFVNIGTLTGIGIPPFISYKEMIDFGQVELTKPKDSTVILLKNIGSEVVEFDSIVQGGPNFRDFTFTEKYKKFSLAPGESKTVTLRFITKEIGLTNGRLMAYYKGIGSPAMIQLYGEGIPRILPIESLTVNIIDTITMERRGISENTYVIGNDRINQTLDTLSEKILAIDSLFRIDTLLKPMIIITGQIKAVGLESDGRIINKPVFKIDLNTSNKYEALLPYVFYEEGSDIIPNRYNKLNNSHVANFTIDQLWYKSTIDIYHDILNIIGKRLTMYPKSVLTIQGNNANTGIEKENTELSRRRAENVKQYLQDIWGIKENRLIVKAGNLPKAKSLPIDDPETAQENRRVEFSSNDYRVIEPLDLKNTMATSNPPKVRFNVQGAADFGVASYTIDAIQAGFNGNSFKQTETSSLPNTIDWEIAKNQALTPKLAKPVTCSLTITDKKGNSKMVGTDQMDIDLITIERKIKEHINGYEVDSFSLILFDFNKSDVEDANKKIIAAIQKRVKKGSEISVTGTTDRIGSEEYNARLSQERANAVKAAINRKGSVSIGKGEQDLRFDNDLPEGRFYCRTVNVVVRTLVE